MSLSADLLTKLNADNVGEALTLADIMPFSPAQFRELADGRLTLGEIDSLYALAQQARKANTVLESQILSRANPQLASLAHLDVSPQQDERGYTDTFPARSGSFVAPGSVSSMFSPAAYLTELYREAKPLHPETSAYNLNKRRPDLGQLVLSQANMDTEISTLSLSNEILMNTITRQQSWSADKVMETLSTYRFSGDTPYHGPYSAIRQSIWQRDPHLSALARSPYFSRQLSPQLLMALEMDIPPELLAILTEDITDENAEVMFEKNFGSLPVEYLSSVNNLAHYYDLSTTEVAALVDITQNQIKGLNKYIDDTLISSLTDGGGQISSWRIKRVKDRDYDTYLNYMDLLIAGKGQFYVVANYKSDGGKVSLRLNQPQDIYLSPIGVDGHTYKNTPYASNYFSLADDVLSEEFRLLSLRYRVGSSSSQDYAYAKFRVEPLPNTFFILELNKIIRFYKASGFTLPEMERFALDIGTVATFSDVWLHRTAYAKYLAQHYTLPLEAGLILADADIGTASTPVLPSQFDLLFNTPPLNGQTFALGGNAIMVNPAKLAPADSFRRAVLKRAFRVDDAGLWLMHQIGNRTVTDSVANTLGNLSDLYRIALLAQAHALTVDELNTLLLLSPYRNTQLYGIDETTLKEITQYLFFATAWLAEQKWSVSQLFVMVTSTYSTTWTPALDDLQQTLLNGLGDQPDLAGDALVTAMAPFIASSLHLNTSNLAESCLLWANQINPAGQTVDSFWALIQKAGPTPAERNDIIAFAQTLAQLALVVNNTAISEQELALLVGNPALLASGMTTLGLSVEILQQLTLFHRWINGAGNYVNDALTALNNGTLDATLLANTLQKDVTQVTQAMAHAAPDVTKLAHWDDVFTVIQWLDVAGVLGLTPDGIAELMALTYGSTTSYATWSGLGDMMLGVLNAQDSEAVHGVLDAGLSAALSNYYMREVSPVALNSRDDLYSYLLIDNRVSAQVKTSRLAEAIASVQLYVYRTLNGQESGADTAVSTRQFFADWDTYNARYSTWAGVSQLVYYPENYVDPTMRVGQTAMMDNMLQDIGQSNLNANTVDTAFKSYLNTFEDIANLNMVSGYQDNVNFDSGLTYFIGKSPDVSTYYWRTVDQNLFTSVGKYPANAWSEWREVTTAVAAYQDMVRPVIFNSRLNTVWLERESITTQDSQGKDVVSYKNTVKLSKLGYDGAWSEVKTYNVDKAIKDFNDSDLSNLGFYCSSFASADAIAVLFYVKKNTMDQNKSTSVSGLFIYPDMTSKIMTSAESESIKGLAYDSFDTLVHHHVVKEIADSGYTFPSSVNNNSGFERGYDHLTRVGSGKIIDIKQVSMNVEKVTLKLNAITSIYYAGDVGRPRDQAILMRMYNKNKLFSLFTHTHSSSGGVDLYSVWEPSSKGMGVTNPAQSSGYTLYSMDYSVTCNYTIPPNERYLYLSGAELLAPAEGSGLRSSDSKGIKTTADHSYEINADVLPKDVIITISAGKAVKTFAADTYVSSLPNFDLDGMQYYFSDMEFDIPTSEFVNDTATVYVKCSAKSVDDRNLGSETFTFTVNRQSNSSGTVSFTNTTAYAQYLQRDVRRVRTNTLFARQLIAKANAGIDQVLTMNSQLLPEPQMGNGGYISIKLPKYDANTHGSSRQASILIDSYKYRIFTFWSGMLNDTEQNIRLFVPLSWRQAPFYDVIDFPGSLSDGLDVYLKPQNKDRIKAGNLKTAIQGDSIKITGYAPVNAPPMTVTTLPDTTEPMDFDGANALYFWEMFYYTPAMVCARLLQESQYDEALTWLKYIWSPAGYISAAGSKAPYYWNCRPLEEDTSWNATPLDSVDPDAVAQNDPMHYKVATFMSMLDLLIARGDAAYRQLERDTLNEAKMWYLQALNLLGDEPYVPLNGEWENPSLASAASKTTQSAYQQALLTLRETGLAAEPLTANTLTALFLPEVNGKLQSYWQLLAQRLYNLRHNLSIDGQPLSLPLFATPVSPAALQSAAVASSQGGGALPPAIMPLYRFPVMLNNTRTLVSQLMQFGSMLQGIIERQDGEAMAELLQTQACDLSVTAIAMQDQTIAEVEADEKTLQASRQGAQNRYTTYASLYDENINTGEKQAMDLYLSASVIAASGDALRTTAAAMDLVPNIYGLAVGGSKFGAMFDAMAISTDVASQATRISGDRISYNESYRRRRQDWAIQRNNAEDELRQIDAQLVSLGIRREAAVLQKTYLQTQQAQTQAQLEFLQRKFSNKALYNWLRGCLSAIYYQFYDLTVSRCLMSQEAYRWEMNQPEASFIKPGAWNSTYAGLMAGENLMLNLTQMEDAYLKQDERQKEVTRTVSLAQVYASLKEGKDFVLADEVKALVSGTSTAPVGTDTNGMKLTAKGTLESFIKLADLAIMADYPDELGDVRRIRQISVTLPMLMGPYQDVQAVLSYGGSVVMPRGCDSLAVSHGMNDSGQFQLDFNDAQLLPFEGIPVNDTGSLTLSFPNATGKQETLLLSLSDIILHIRYTIRH